uniref:TSC22 domain family member 3 n=1 Tax=Chelonoidis abingdonii TaxID=106734 RepID=A0A8C0H6G2_CHEAB
LSSAMEVAVYQLHNFSISFFSSCLRDVVSVKLDNSASGASVVAIDNKIEQAMDLVKTHLMYAVRRRWRSSREQIKELVEKNSQLERENSLLKTLASPKHGEIPVLAACRGAIRRGAGRGGCPGPAHQGSAV